MSIARSIEVEREEKIDNLNSRVQGIKSEARTKEGRKLYFDLLCEALFDPSKMSYELAVVILDKDEEFFRDFNNLFEENFQFVLVEEARDYLGRNAHLVLDALGEEVEEEKAEGKKPASEQARIRKFSPVTLD